MLNEAQKMAVEILDGPLRIVAGAGTGKTKTLVARIARLIESGKAKPREILALTFTHKAAHELNERLRDEGFPRVQATTFHGFCASVLRRYGAQDFVVLPEDEQKDFVRNLLHAGERENLNLVLSDLNRVREAVASGAKWPELFSGISLERLGEIWSFYRSILGKKNGMDFTGLLTGVLELWKEQPKVLAECQARYRYILVDEYQDVSAIQIEIVKQLGGADVAPADSQASRQNVCVVGDPDQTIYSWRGSHIKSLDDFLTIFPNAKTVILTQNYRNPSSILIPAEQLISHNADRIPKILEPTLPSTLPIHLWSSTDEWQMNEMIFHLLEQFFGSHDHMARADELDVGRGFKSEEEVKKIRNDSDFFSFGDVAILYRTQSQGRLLAAHFVKRGYPFQLSAPTEFWQRKEIQKFLEKLNAIRRIEYGSQKTLEGIEDGEEQKQAKEQGTDKAPLELCLFSDWLRTHLEQFIWNQSIPENKAGHLLHLLTYAMGYDHFLLSEALSEFLDAAATAQDADHVFASDKIHLLTLHAAKGLEFPIVLILGLEEGVLPHRKLKDEPYWLAEERRLLYVGMTRAKEQLHLFTTRKIDSRHLEPSRFIAEIGAENLTYGELPAMRAKLSRRAQVKKSQMSLF